MNAQIIAAAQKAVDIWNDENGTLDEYWTAVAELFALTGRTYPNRTDKGLYTSLNIVKGYLK